MIFRTPFLNLALPVLVTFLHVPDVHGFIPAQPSNVTVQGNGVNGANTSRLHLQWYTNGSDWEYVTPQSLGSSTTGGPAQGVFVHFTEDSAGNESTTTPWIAFVSCDANATDSSQEADILTMAKDRGAKSAILYSLYSETCVINPGYQGPVLDVFTTQTLNASLRIEYEFGQFGPSSAAYYGHFNATMLNDAARLINNTLAVNYPTTPGFLFATLPAYNASGTGGGLQSDTNGTASSTSSGDGDSQNTGIAMIVLYAITGCVSALFCAVIVSGAIRAIRYPERYGPRAADPTLGGGQSRARGLGRAILDTFPIVKFGSSGDDEESNLPRPKDVESTPMGTESSPPVPVPNSIQLAQLGSTVEHDEHHDDPGEGSVASMTGQEARTDGWVSQGTHQVDLLPQTNTAEHGASRAAAPPPEIDARMPECIGREICPICIVDFEEGDDLRVLPCEGKHRFHQSCVDPWLLELSASCPICRQDFRALETIISGESETEASPVSPHTGGSTSTTQNRFSRYLHFARRRQRRSSTRDQTSLPPLES